MKLYVIIKTARKDVKKFPEYFPNPQKPEICIVDSGTGDACTPDKEKVEETTRRQTEEYGRYFNYKVYELEVGL